MVEANLASAMRIIDDMPNTPAGLLRARQKFDKMLNDQAKGAALTPKLLTQPPTLPMQYELLLMI